MAAHCSQGPQLGLPQMIQSRPQFGYIGAILVWLFAYLQYAGFNVFNTLLASESVTSVTGGGIGQVRLWLVVGTALAAAAAIYGYDLIHRMERALTYGFLLLFGILTIIVLTLHYPAGSFSLGNFDLTPFLLQFSVVAGYQISWAIYVSDYSRYLPPEVTIRKTFLWTYGGSALGAAWIMFIGSALAAWAGLSFSGTGIAELHTVGNKFFDGFGGIILLYSALGLLSVTALNMYGGSLTLISALDSFKKVRPTLAVRLSMIGFTAALSLVIALAVANNDSFQANFSNFLLLVLYFFIPWTAVNLVDFFIVRRGHYAIAEIFKPDGIYGRWGWRGIIAYLVGFVAMTPFFSTEHYSGWVANAAHGADYSLFVGPAGRRDPLLVAVPLDRHRGRGAAGRGAGRRPRAGGHGARAHRRVTTRWAEPGTAAGRPILMRRILGTLMATAALATAAGCGSARPPRRRPAGRTAPARVRCRAPPCCR